MKEASFYPRSSRSPLACCTPREAVEYRLWSSQENGYLNRTKGDSLPDEQGCASYHGRAGALLGVVAEFFYLTRPRVIQEFNCFASHCSLRLTIDRDLCKLPR
jgi:hypothetical protein